MGTTTFDGYYDNKVATQAEIDDLKAEVARLRKLLLRFRVEGWLRQQAIGEDVFCVKIGLANELVAAERGEGTK